jgi:MtN3 and saliva related transmembrane protein
MSPELWTAVVGGIAAVCTTVAFVPQVLKTWRQGGRDQSYTMLVLFLTGIVLWFVYGLLIRALVVMLANVFTGALVCLNIAFKRRHETRADP